MKTGPHASNFWATLTQLIEKRSFA